MQDYGACGKRAFALLVPMSSDDSPTRRRRIIKEIKSNHEIQTPEALARNCCLIKELNTNVAAVSCRRPSQSAHDAIALLCYSTKCLSLCR
jgi:hypothetical protein